MDAGARLAHSHQVGTKVAAVFHKRAQRAQKDFSARVSRALENGGPEAVGDWMRSMDPRGWQCYAVDAAQRSILFWETLWRRGNDFVDRAATGLTPVLHFESETVLDGRSFERPVNYALLRILPPEGVRVDPKRRPYVIIDPRAGHGPGIGGFKDDSQVGVALRAGHPVYFVVFFRDPEPGQDLLDVCRAEQRFVKEVRALHPHSPKPAIVGNCQGGWAAMMLAASDPEDTGPVVINGAPMSYWGGAWTEDEAANPMRYAGGMLGGSWAASLASDLGNGKFDGAHLVQNFENLNPANSFWDKYYHLFDRADTEPPRFLEFERWWGGYYLMNREEIEWITRNLFVGNKLWAGQVQGAGSETLDLRQIRAPIVLFASMGDNITPAQQAFNWVADVYGSTEEIKARGQVIVGLLHDSIGHLGIFVSGKVARKEHAQIVSVLKSVELLPPGLYGMEITERAGAGGEVEYEVEFHEKRLEDVARHLNRFDRVDEKPFEAVEALSDFNQRAYELFARPIVQAMSNDYTAQLLRQFHPLRMRNWSFSQFNPWLSWLAPAAEAVREHRRPVEDDHALRRREKVGAELVSASLDYFRAMRDASTEAGFFSIYANLFALYEKEEAPERPAEGDGLRDSPLVQRALESIAKGGYVEALARVAFLLMRKGEPLPLSRLELRAELIESYADYLPQLPMERWRATRGEQEIIARFAPEEAVATLPALLEAPAERERLLGLLDKLMNDGRVLGARPTPQQVGMLVRIRSVLAEPEPRPRRAALSEPARRSRRPAQGRRTG